MRVIREILRLTWDCKLSQRQIASSCNIARASVGEYVRRAQAAGLSWPLPDQYDDEVLNKLLFPQAAHSSIPRPLPDFNEIHQKLQKKGATLALFWERYRWENPDGYQYSQFCQLYRDWAKTIDVVMRQEHRAGEKLFSDFAGSKLLVTNSHTGVMSEAHLFVCALGASSYTYAEAFFSENSEAWCTGHANAFGFMGGSVEIIVPDNPRSVVDKPCPYEPDIHADFQHMASFFGAAVVPARVRKPRDKAKAEAAVRVATMWIIAVLRERQFFSLAELNTAVRALLERLNDRPFQKIPGSRRSRFEAVDRPVLKSLPSTPYEYTNIGVARVNLDYHISVLGGLYSVPFQYARKQIEYRLTAKTIEVFLLGRRIASHPRLWIENSHSTIKEHMPSTHRFYAEWTPQRLIEWGTQTGPATAQLVREIMNRRQYPEQGFRSCLGILKLSKTTSPERLELAAQRALAINALSYRHIKLILENKLEGLSLPEKPIQLSIAHDNIRGASAFSTSEDIQQIKE